VREREQEGQQRHRPHDHGGDARRHPLHTPIEEGEPEEERQRSVRNGDRQDAPGRQWQAQRGRGGDGEHGRPAEAQCRTPEWVQLPRRHHDEHEVRAAEHHDAGEREQDTTVDGQRHRGMVAVGRNAERP
jgi:hypothetical protein